MTPRLLARRSRILTLLPALALVVAGCGGGDGDPGPTSSAPAEPADGGTAVLPAGSPQDVTTDLTAPWSIAFVGDTALISSRDDGDIWELTADGSTRLVGTVDGVVHEGESGLLGLAVDEQDRLYAYSTAAGGNRVQRFALDGAPGSYELGAVETILDGIPAARNHDGGRIAFGPDQMLYVATGDANDRPAAQDPDSLAGKILRLTPDGAAPDDNPVAGSIVYTLGHRNPQGIAWADDGTMFAAEFGQDTWDELNIITPGANYGWPEVEGIGGDDRFVDPVQQWEPSTASPSGIAVADGTVFIANLRGAVLRSVPVADPTTSIEHFADQYGRLRDVVVAPDGDLWFLTNNTDGRGDPAGGDDRILRVGLEPA
ncbi:MAG: PQQ-dependent sugar dehydrogenase [Aeromicrobium sp.]|uniref:PQQ-dependent sugar dehydrogenase n=1 Tax=Aeromicrobium sp. TaxID=1871063 RepID=UPI0025C64315|nr:PQQ-dependent sugar dehydrogenase [Aeromicrobium sp.]MCK5892352.1 PQQ-dependent sugar dehydrogenase [Aeromicrobium sp.]MDF1706026.1 PQQ-dependent sugar dehydrogenase [Aeromicrobium sp.]